MSRVAAATIVAKNFLSYARVLADSFLRHHPDVPLFVLLADEVDGYFDPRAEAFRMLEMAEIRIPDSSGFRARLSRKECAIAAKPYLLRHLLDRGFSGVIFVDPDVLILSDLRPLFGEVSRHAVVLTPHLVAPLAGPGRVARELNILQSGVFNGGLIGVSAAPGARRFLTWWAARVCRDCRRDLAQGLYYDQRWLDLALVFFDGMYILRDPGYNVAHWNLPERDVQLDGDDVRVDGRPCRFVHFSGFDPDEPTVVTRHSSRLNMSSLGPVRTLFNRYAALLRAAGYDETKTWPYAYDRHGGYP